MTTIAEYAATQTAIIVANTAEIATIKARVSVLEGLPSAPPVYSLEAALTVVEGDTISYTVRRTGSDLSMSGSVKIGLGGGSTSAEAADLVSGFNDATAVFAPGEAFRVVAIQTVNDTLVEGTEQLRAFLKDAVNGTISTTAGQIMVSILDNDATPAPGGAVTLGMNISGGSWFEYYRAYANIANYSFVQDGAEDGNGNRPVLALDSDGGVTIPATDGLTYFGTIGAPAGTVWVFEYVGDAEIERIDFILNSTEGSSTGTGVNRKRTIEMTPRLRADGTQDAPLVTWDKGSGAGKIKSWDFREKSRPRSEKWASEAVTEIARFKGGGRFMDWVNSNGNFDMPWTWAQRPKATDLYFRSALAFTLEDAVALCNVANIDFWWPFPLSASKDYMDSAMAYIHGNLLPGLKCVIEDGNETENSGFGTYLWARSRYDVVHPEGAPNNGTGGEFEKACYLNLELAQQRYRWIAQWCSANSVTLARGGRFCRVMNEIQNSYAVKRTIKSFNNVALIDHSTFEDVAPANYWGRLRARSHRLRQTKPSSSAAA